MPKNRFNPPLYIDNNLIYDNYIPYIRLFLNLYFLIFNLFYWAEVKFRLNY